MQDSTEEPVGTEETQERQSLFLYEIAVALDPENMQEVHDFIATADLPESVGQENAEFWKEFKKHIHK